jgi:hypothetical protein
MSRPTYDELFEIYQLLEDYFPDQFREIKEFIEKGEEE